MALSKEDLTQVAEVVAAVVGETKTVTHQETRIERSQAPAKAEYSYELVHGTYKGHPMLEFWLTKNGKRCRRTPELSFGKTKAALILQHLAEIQAFAK